MPLKYANNLSDGQLKEIYQLFLCEDDKIILLDISRYTVNDFFPDGGYIFAGKTVSHPVDKESLKAWMKLPEPFKPGRCDKCKYLEQ